MEMTEIVLMVGLNFLAWKAKHAFMWLIMVPVNVVFGLVWAVSSGYPGDSGFTLSVMVEGVIIAVIGGWYLVKVLTWLIDRIRR